MKTLNKGLLILLTSVLLTLTGCGSSPTKKSAVNQTPPINNTKWHYMDSDWEYNMEFLSSGLMRTNHPNDTTPNNDNWEQKGEMVIFYFNDRYSTYRGKFINRDLISGTATSKNGATWRWKIKRL